MLRSILGARVRLDISTLCEDCFRRVRHQPVRDGPDQPGGQCARRHGRRKRAGGPHRRGRRPFRPFASHAGSRGDFVTVAVADSGEASREEDTGADLRTPILPRPRRSVAAFGLGLASPVYGFAEQSGGDVAVEKAAWGAARPSPSIAPHPARRNHGQRFSTTPCAATTTGERAGGRGQCGGEEEGRNGDRRWWWWCRSASSPASCCRTWAIAPNWRRAPWRAWRGWRRTRRLDNIVFSDVVMPGISGVERWRGSSRRAGRACRDGAEQRLQPRPGHRRPPRLPAAAQTLLSGGAVAHPAAGGSDGAGRSRRIGRLLDPPSHRGGECESPTASGPPSRPSGTCAGRPRCWSGAWRR